MTLVERGGLVSLGGLGPFIKFVDNIKNGQYSQYYPLTHREATNPSTQITKIGVMRFSNSISFLPLLRRWLHGKVTETLHIYHGFVLYMCILKLTTVLYFLFTLCCLPLGSNTVMRSSALLYDIL